MPVAESGPVYEIEVGSGFFVSFERTIRLPDDGRIYPLTPDLGALPIGMFEDLAVKARRELHALGEPIPTSTALIPLHVREALWIRFHVQDRPRAVVVTAGGVNVVSGELQEVDGAVLRGEAEQNYVVCPPQVWLDGIHAGEAEVRQFVATRLGEGYTVEAQITGREEVGGIGITTFGPRAGIDFGEAPPSAPPEAAWESFAEATEESSPGEARLGLAAGGRMRQKIYRDPHGLGVWDSRTVARLIVHLVTPSLWEAWTGFKAPPSPISAALYAAFGLPWFEVDDAHAGDVAPSHALSEIVGIAELDRRFGAPPDPEDGRAVPFDDHVHLLRPSRVEPALEIQEEH